jgi:hypothetical protein
VTESLVCDQPAITIEAIRYVVHQLTRPRTVLIAGQTLARPAMLTQLIVGVRSDAGGTRRGSGLPNERSAIDLSAFSLYEDISGRIASMLDSATGLAADSDPRINLDRWLDAFELAWFRGQITYDAQLRQAYSRLIALGRRITDHFDPASVGELEGPCPNCGERTWYSDSKGSKTTALFTKRRDGEVEACCHWCGSQWTGWSGLTALRLSMGDTPDHIKVLESWT